ncbi:MAG: ATP-binding cassette domain-containing protein [Dermabacter sp.]|nr:ATP-binding cassette domain-containing protein [Dermabacter sp.]
MPSPSTAPAPVLTLHEVSHTWPDATPALAPTSLSLHEGRTGLVGANGAGKTTLLRLITGELTPTTGTITRTGPIGVLPQHVTTGRPGAQPGTLASAMGIDRVLDALTALEGGDASEAVFEAIGDAWDIAARAEAALAHAGLASLLTASPAGFERPLATMSGGEIMRAALAGLTLAPATLTLLDEPTNNLDREAREALYDQLRAWRSGSLLVVSHDVDLLEIMDHTAELRAPHRRGSTLTEGARLRVFSGGYSTYREAVDAEQAAAVARLQAAEQDAARAKKERIDTHRKRQQAEARGKRSRASAGLPRIVLNAMAGGAENTTARAKALHEGREAKAHEAVQEADALVRRDARLRITLEHTTVPAGREVLRLSVPPEQDVVVRGPERIALRGPNGSGKTTLLFAIARGNAPASPADGPVSHGFGTVSRVAEVHLVPQTITFADESASILATVAEAAPQRTENDLRAELAKFLFTTDTVHRSVGALSGGERYRVALARVLLAEPAPQLLLIDEPTNNLDLDSVQQVQDALVAFRGALIVVSHDEHFLDALNLTRHWSIRSGLLSDEGAATRAASAHPRRSGPR